MTDEELVSLSKRGFIPGENEEEEAFLKRVHFNLSLENSFGSDPSLRQYLHQIHLRSYDLKADWVPLFFGNQKLPPWQGGCAWIFQTEKEGPIGSVIQLRKSFSKKGAYFGLKLKEILEHEMVHIGRMAFEEPKYEEFLAYSTSDSKFRRWMGPLFQSSYESLILVFLFLLPLFFDLFFLMEGINIDFKQSLFIKSVPFVYLTYLLVRLYFRKSIFEKAKSNLVHWFGKEGEAILYRLRDQEIERASRLKDPTHLFTKDSLRVRQIKAAYLKN